MSIRIGNAPCSRGVEFASDPRNPDWRQVLKECAEAGYKGIELGPVGFMPEDPAILGDALAENGLELIGGVVFRPYHDPDAWADVLDATHRTARALKAHGAQHLVLIDSISPRRAPTAGRAGEAEQMEKPEWQAYRDRIAESARIGAEEYGLTVGIHAHAAGFMDFEPELERLLDEVDESILKICFDTGHHSYAGYDPRRSRTGPASMTPAGKASSASWVRATSISRRCGRSCWMRDIKAGARSNRTAIRRWMSRRWQIAATTGNTSNPSASSRRRHHEKTWMGHDRRRRRQPDRARASAGRTRRRAL